MEDCAASAHSRDIRCQGIGAYSNYEAPHTPKREPEREKSAKARWMRQLKERYSSFTAGVRVYVLIMVI